MDSRCGSDVEEAQHPIEPAGNLEESKPLASFQKLVSEVEDVLKSIEDSVMWNKEQCRRIANRYSGIVEMLKSMTSAGNSGSVLGSTQEFVADVLLHEIQKVQTVISGCVDGSQGLTNVVSLIINPEAFKELHEDLEAAMEKLVCKKWWTIQVLS